MSASYTGRWEEGAKIKLRATTSPWREALFAQRVRSEMRMKLPTAVVHRLPKLGQSQPQQPPQKCATSQSVYGRGWRCGEVELRDEDNYANS
jgi:hypothetical protein